MLNLSLSEVALWTRGELLGADGPVRQVATDSRHIDGGELFVALAGEHHDGHDHVAAAARAGASAALVARPLALGLPQVVVADTLAALGDLASAVRARRTTRVIGITGSNGKTTVRMLAAAILSRYGRTHATAGNFNNEIGLPLSLLAMPQDAEYAVLEMGAGKPGDIAYLASIARPDIGLVTTIAPAHLARMGSLQGIAETKGALYEALPADGTAIVNADGDFSEFFTGLAAGRRVLRFGMGAHADVHAQMDSMDAVGSRFRLATPGGEATVNLPLPGRHNIANALAAAAIACALAVPVATIAEALEQVQPVAGRLAARSMPGGWTLIDDSYNANPGSASAAIDTLLLSPGEHWLVLGDMGELGPKAEALHAELGERARRCGVERLFTTGPLARAAARGFGAHAQHFEDRGALVEALRAALHENVVCLVKGSRAAAMDRVVAALDAGGGDDAA